MSVFLRNAICILKFHDIQMYQSSDQCSDVKLHLLEDGAALAWVSLRGPLPGDISRGVEASVLLIVSVVQVPVIVGVQDTFHDGVT